ncbi:uncharacterized protein LOC135198536 isoform X2 [Macrobrachium nipponense]|uniref:uncharacterized protein LOC135198536 isoform X2 n=1 Tax=Macrobrachium nipponense TaxID=159736 RepID=UPI0030C8CA89
MGIIESAIIKLTGDVKSDVRAAANNRGNSATQRTISLVGNEKKKISHHTFTRQWLLPSDVLANDKNTKKETSELRNLKKKVYVICCDV